MINSKERAMSISQYSNNYAKNKVFFEYPITKNHIEQQVVSLSLNCGASERAIVAHIKDTFDYSISPANVHNILRRNIYKAQDINKNEDLSAVKIGAHDEIFQNNKPILVGCDTKSTYIYLLSLQNSRDGDTWGVCLLECADRGLQLDHSVADGGLGLRAGQAAAFPGVDCHEDIFHPLQDLTDEIRYHENKAFAALHKYYSLESRVMKTLPKESEKDFGDAIAIGKAFNEVDQKIRVAENLETIFQWLREDILSVVGPSHETRCLLFDFLIEELQKLELLSPHIKKLRVRLQKARDNLLLFAQKIDRKLASVAAQFKLDMLLIRQVFELQAIPPESQLRWNAEKFLRKELGATYYAIAIAIKEIIRSAVRASSVVENVNSRLRVYFFFRKSFGPESLELLRFFLNHKPFVRSAFEERVGKCPTELLTGIKPLHWLELLGYKRFQSNLAIA
jgi:hypothetical protein